MGKRYNYWTEGMFQIRVRSLSVVTSCFPLVGLLLCVLISYWRDFEGVNQTHCKVYNFLPSISASIGNYTPQRYIWRIAVAFHISPRLLFTALYYNWHMQDVCNGRSYRMVCQVNVALNIMELFCLIGLTYISSNENYGIHEKCFILFAVFAALHMITTIYLCYYRKAQMHRHSLKLKVYTFCTFIISIISFTYLFERHNRYCEPYVYSIFAFFEYLSVISNIGFHATAALDFSEQAVVISNQQTEGDYLIR